MSATFSAAGGDRVVVRSAARPDARVTRFYSDRSQIALRMLTRGEEPADDGADSATDRGGDRVSRHARDRRDGVPARARRSRSAAVAHRRSVRRLSRRADAVAGRWIACCPLIVVDAAGAGCSPRGILARNDPRTRALEGLEQKVEVLAGDVPESIAVTENGVRLRRGPAARPEDRPVPRSAREPGGRGAVRARTAARLLQLQRRLRARARAPVRGDDRDRRLRGRHRARAGRTPRATAWRSTRASATCSTSCAGSSGSASGSTRSCSIRRRSRRTRPP